MKNINWESIINSHRAEIKKQISETYASAAVNPHLGFCVVIDSDGDVYEVCDVGSFTPSEVFDGDAIIVCNAPEQYNMDGFTVDDDEMDAIIDLRISDLDLI